MGYFTCHTYSFPLLQGLILSNALRAQKNIEDEGYTMALNNLRSEVIELRNEGLEKDKILISLVNKVKEYEASFKAQAEIQKNEIKDLRKQLAEAKEKCGLAEANPKQFLMSYEATISSYGGNAAIMAKSFVMAVRNVAQTWYSSLRPGTITSWQKLKDMLVTSFQGF